MSIPTLRLYSISEDEKQQAQPTSPTSKKTLPQSPTMNFKFFPKSSSLFRLKCTTTKLGLNNRRPSIEAWKKTVKSRDHHGHDESDDDTITEERIESINSSLDWIRSELTQMKKQDQSLASQFLRIKKAIYNLKLEWSCLDHQCMFEEAETEMESRDELRRVTDLPVQSDLEQSLIEKGFTRMNMSLKRYSIA